MIKRKWDQASCDGQSLRRTDGHAALNHQHVVAPRIHLWLWPISKDKNDRINCRGRYQVFEMVFYSFQNSKNLLILSIPQLLLSSLPGTTT
jgi:hypothetical protein